MKTVKLITCDDAFQAHVIQGALKNEGIASVSAPHGGRDIQGGIVEPMTIVSYKHKR